MAITRLAEKAKKELLDFIEGLEAGGALIVWRDNNEADWHILQDGESFRLENE